MSQDKLFDLLKLDLAVPPGVIVTWPPGDLYRAECGCLINVRDAATRVVECSKECPTAAAIRAGAPIRFPL